MLFIVEYHFKSVSFNQNLVYYTSFVIYKIERKEKRWLICVWLILSTILSRRGFDTLFSWQVLSTLSLWIIPPRSSSNSLCGYPRIIVSYLKAISLLVVPSSTHQLNDSLTTLVWYSFQLTDTINTQPLNNSAATPFQFSLWLSADYFVSYLKQ